MIARRPARAWKRVPVLTASGAGTVHLPQENPGVEGYGAVRGAAQRIDLDVGHLGEGQERAFQGE